MNEVIRIEWDGPYSMRDIGYDEENERYKHIKNAKLNDEKIDYGIYQVYGCHPVYGTDVLLYIGKAEIRTFAVRLREEGWEYNSDSKNLKFYVGRLFDKVQPTDTKWNELISITERILIYSHSPAMNLSNILNITKDKKLLKKFEEVRIINYASYRSLMPEISGECWVKSFDDFKGVFGSDELKK